MLRASFLSLIAVFGFGATSVAQVAADGGAGQDGAVQPGRGTFSIGRPESETNSSASAVFTDRRHLNRYKEILGQLEKMKPSDSSEPSETDWFVVGGAITDKSSGRSLVRFGKVQGPDMLAQEVVKFLYAPRGNAAIGWRIFERVENQSAADQKLASVQDEYQQWQRQQRQLQQQRMARARSRQMVSYSRANSFFRGYSGGRYCAPGRG